MKEPVISPRISFLEEQDKERLLEAALRILGEIGMLVLHEGARELLLEAGCGEGADRRVTIPSDVVRGAIRSAPERIEVADRAGASAMDLGGRRAYFGTGSDLLYRVDAAGERRRCVNEDVRRAARLADALPNLDFVMSMATPSEVDPHRSYLVSYGAMVTSSVKPVVSTAENREDLAEIWAIAAELRGGEAELRRAPYLLHYSEPASPLRHPFDSLEKVLFCAEKAVPLVYSPAPLAGASAPITVAGHVSLGLAESLCGLVIHQLRAPGAPFLLGMGAAVMDMATGQSLYNAPEYLLAYMSMVELAHHLDLPCWGYAGTTDAPIPDAQATFEGGLLTFLSTFAGANLNHDVGYLEFGLTGSLELMVVHDELIALAKRMLRGVVVDDETLAFEAIRDVGTSGNYLEHAHTLAHFRAAQWRPKLLNRLGFERWEEAGRKDLLQRASERVNELLESDEPAPLEPALQRAIEERVDRFRT